jgi:CheY-like chemotaxis protein
MSIMVNDALANRRAEVGILIVDDEYLMLKVLDEVLRTAGFRAVFKADDGFEALAILERQKMRIQVVVIDFVMPVLSGLDVIRRMSDVCHWPLATIMMTGWGSKDVADEFYSLGTPTRPAVRFFRKPPDIHELISAIDEASQVFESKHDPKL